jgi:hypothetical protein
MAINMSLKKSGARTNDPLSRLNDHVTRGLQRVTSLSRINHIRVELRIFGQEL